jgi:hypothetical protein
MKKNYLSKGLAVVFFLLMLSVANVMAQIDYCEGNFDYDDDQDGSDAFTFKTDFGRSLFKNPCPPDGPSPVPRTGQTNSHALGDDGFYEKGIAWPNPRFIDKRDGTITDNLTGLIWLKNANCFGHRNWWEAIADCNELGNGQCGLTDGSSPEHWRLPNRFELASLLDMQYYGPQLSNSAGTGQWAHGDPFINLITDGIYWTSTTFAFETNFAWYVEFDTGIAGTGISSGINKSDVNYVWPVRGGH